MIKQIQRGAELLDDIRPNWHNEIDTEALDIDDYERCILGQLYGDYSSGLDSLDIDLGRDHGFNNEMNWDRKKQTALWITEITKRKEAR